MRHTFGLRQKMVMVVIFFMILIFILIHTQHSNRVEQIVIEAEKNRNMILVDTMLPILRTNLAFGLIDSNRQYLDTIAGQNSAVLSITLLNESEKVIYSYAVEELNPKQNRPKSYSITKTITDDATQSLLGKVKIEFSHRYYDAVLQHYESFVIEYIVIFVLMLAAMIFVLQRLSKPFNMLIEQIKEFDPQKENFSLSASGLDNELGVIQNALIDMIMRIERYHRELNLLNSTLEQKVDDRTRALADEVDKVKKQEKMLIAQSRLAAMGEMMSMIAHQWRQPLATSTLMITQYKVSAMLGNRERDQRDEILDNISDTLIYLSDTIDDFQTYFKPDKAKSECQISSIIERSVTFSRARLESYAIAMKVRCDETICAQTYFNELVQITLNLINNAIDAIRIQRPHLKEIYISCEQKEEQIFIYVCDTGGGIPDEIMSRIFEPYFSTKGKNGTGLGLYMAKMIVERHVGGEISVKNENGGACFTIVFSA